MFQIKAIDQNDRNWVCQVVEAQWGSTRVVTRGRIYLINQLPGFIAVKKGARLGLVTYRIEGKQCEIVTLNSFVEGIGVGSSLVDKVRNVAICAKCDRLWLITTNDNMKALRFYQKLGFHLVAVHRDALEKSRRLKPEIPRVGLDGIPLRDEIELEMLL